MNALATLTQRLTLPYRRGGEFDIVPLCEKDEQPGVTKFRDYAFSEYRARWGEAPDDIAYVLTPQFDLGGDEVVVTLAFTQGHDSATVSVTFPGGTRAGDGAVVPLKGPTGVALKFSLLTASPPGPGIGKYAWTLTALLGNIAKLSWLIGGEKDLIARVGRDVRATRLVASARGAGLDGLGADMRVPRFPPRPYSADAATIALWHLDEPAGSPTVVDQMTRDAVPGHPELPAAVGHPGQVTGAQAGGPGKYGSSFTFSGSGNTVVAVPASPDFDFTVSAGATVEAFVTVAQSDSTPRAILSRRKQETAAASAAPGWSLCVMDARGIAANVYFAVCDGTAPEIRLFGDVSLADGLYHHVAGVIDRAHDRVRLYVDGVQRMTAPLAGLGAIAPPDDLRFGATTLGNPFAGTIDEVRLSRTARTSFHPALGEDDDAYRARLKLFRRWVLPTPDAVLGMVNEAAPLPGDNSPYVLVEDNQTTQTVLRAIRALPKSVPVGSAIAADGSRARDETVAGSPDDDAGFDPALDLITYKNGAVDSAGDPGQARLQVGMAALLDQLVTVAGGTMTLEQSYDPAGPTPLHTVGRAVRLRHDTKDADNLGVLAHQVGFDYVENLGPDLALAVAPGERLAIRGAGGPRVDAGTAFDLTVDPPLPNGGTISWTIVTPGPGKAHLVAHSADAASTTPIASRRRVRLVTDAAGDVAVRVEFSLSGRTRSGTLGLRIDPVALPVGHAISSAGQLDGDPTAMIGAPDDGFDQAFLIAHPPTPNVSFATADSTLMQPTTRDALAALLALLAARGIGGDLKVEQAFVAGGLGVESVGRRLVLGHSTLALETLAALAAQCFDYVQNGNGEVNAYVGPDVWLGLRLTPDKPLPTTVTVGDTLTLATNPGLPNGSYTWGTQSIGNGEGAFGTVTQPTAQYVATQPGMTILVLTYVVSDTNRVAPYSFEIRLKPALELAGTPIPKPQYDIIMNVLDAFHPIGVQVKTDHLRLHVREIENDPMKAFPSYSFPNFRY